MNKINLILKQTILVSVDLDGIDEDVNFLETINNGHLEVIDVNSTISTEDGIEFEVDDMSSDDVKQHIMDGLKKL